MTRGERENLRVSLVDPVEAVVGAIKIDNLPAEPTLCLSIVGASVTGVGLQQRDGCYGNKFLSRPANICVGNSRVVHNSI